MQRQGRPGMGRARCLQDAASWSAARDTRLADRLRCPRRQMRQRSWADRLTLGPRKEVVDPLCLQWPGSACHVGHFAPLGEVCPLRPSPSAIQFFSTHSQELFAGLQHSTGGKERLGRIWKQGNRHLESSSSKKLRSGRWCLDSPVQAGLKESLERLDPRTRTAYSSFREERRFDGRASDGGICRGGLSSCHYLRRSGCSTAVRKNRYESS